MPRTAPRTPRPRRQLIKGTERAAGEGRGAARTEGESIRQLEREKKSRQKGNVKQVDLHQQIQQENVTSKEVEIDTGRVADTQREK